jgi:predicted anti-sigma-YlaC factor YlaD
VRTCKDISKLVSESVDRELSLRERMGMRMHWVMCSLCRAYQRQVLQLRAILKGAAQPNAPVEQLLPEEARQRIKRALKTEES